MDTTTPFLDAQTLVRNASGTWSLDSAGSAVEFHVKHFWRVITVHGHFDRIDGEGTVDKAGGISGQLRIAAGSLSTKNLEPGQDGVERSTCRGQRPLRPGLSRRWRQSSKLFVRPWSTFALSWVHLSDAELESPAYPSEWTVADVLSHIGSGAVIMQRRLDDIVEGNATPEGFAPQVWETWNAKSARAKADDALMADRDLLERIESLSDEARSSFRFSMGPLELDFEGFVGMRLNEHALHTWDIEVAHRPECRRCRPSQQHTSWTTSRSSLASPRKPTGSTRAIAVRTDQPRRDFSIELSADAVTLAAGDRLARRPISNFRPRRSRVSSTGGWIRLIPRAPFATPVLLEELRNVFPGP